MGPRFDERGNEATRLNGDNRRHVLQWGRASMSAETGSGDHEFVGYIIASMGPRFDERGNGHPAHGGEGLGRASMGPRFDERGNTVLYSENREGR